ncbi:hypothetical protein [Microbacterium sp. As-52]|uniref:hypothetical protein n=1 Tax=Microbacterium sp. As-52 TaxID=3390503 RepID=UPI003CE9DB7D
MMASTTKLPKNTTTPEATENPQARVVIKVTAAKNMPAKGGNITSGRRRPSIERWDTLRRIPLPVSGIEGLTFPSTSEECRRSGRGGERCCASAASELPAGSLVPLGAEDGDDRDVDEVNGVMHQHRAYLRVQDVHPGRRVSVDGLGENAILPKTIDFGGPMEVACRKCDTPRIDAP